MVRQIDMQGKRGEKIHSINKELTAAEPPATVVALVEAVVWQLASLDEQYVSRNFHRLNELINQSINQLLSWLNPHVRNQQLGICPCTSNIFACLLAWFFASLIQSVSQSVILLTLTTSPACLEQPNSLFIFDRSIACLLACLFVNLVISFQLIN